MKLGYARVSTIGQTIDRQIDQLRAHGCDRIFEERASGARKDRPELDKLFSTMRSGDSLVVTSLDRLGRSMRHLMDMIDAIKDEGVELVSLKETLDTSTSGGKLVFHIMAALSEFERTLIVERVREGLAAARARGRIGGRPHRRGIPEKKKELLLDYLTRGLTAEQTAAKHGVTSDSVFREVRKVKVGGHWNSFIEGIPVGVKVKGGRELVIKKRQFGKPAEERAENEND